MSIDAPSPFGRGANAPLAGRTILQIVPPVAAGGDEGATLAVDGGFTAATIFGSSSRNIPSQGVIGVDTAP